MLKCVVKRHWGTETAPPGLRERVKAAMQRQAPSHPRRIVPAAWLAIAALVLVGVGAALYWVLGDRAGAYGGVSLTSMVRTHDDSFTRSSHQGQVVLAQSGFPSLGRSLSAELGCPVLAADLTDEGWTFQGACLCQVDGRRAAHLLYTQGQKSISVFSVSPCNAPDEGCRCRKVGDHNVVTWAHAGGVHALVAESDSVNLSTDEMEQLLESHQSQLISAEEPAAAAPEPHASASN